ncbi:S41 family peptidase [Niabella beijingensis]|uniref:S41 family peptidase n=1 Tax=Niabella beijingensis TaxID=2872700 RepID=UPI001CBFC4A8|nr:S41 family peptidase [Niabella beijingensis]MBZ4188113.1 S41 family peptidase [Niabella beijingensis]
MKGKLLFCLTCMFLLHTTILFSQPAEVRHLLDTTITLMQKNALNGQKVDWNKIRRQAYAICQKSNGMYEAGNAFRYLFQSVNDDHGMFYYKDSVFRWERHSAPISDSVQNEWNKRSGIKTAIFENAVGYLRVPSMPFSGKEEADKQAQQLNDSLCYLLAQNIKGLIIDLRINGGGAMYPMILGVQQLLPKGKIGSFTGRSNETWYLKENNFLLDSAILASITPKCSNAKVALPVAVLINGATGSSGEFFAIALKVIKNRIFIGEPTAGYATGNIGLQINKEASLLIASSYGRDANETIYKGIIQPDISIISPDSFNDLKKDEKVKAAIKWIKNQMN